MGGPSGLGIDVDQADEVGLLAESMHTMAKKLREMMFNVTNIVETLSSSSTELSAISQQMAATSEQTAQNSSNVSAAAEEMIANMTSVSAASEPASQTPGDQSLFH